jgi:hypothetical protein
LAYEVTLPVANWRCMKSVMSASKVNATLLPVRGPLVTIGGFAPGRVAPGWPAAADDAVPLGTSDVTGPDPGPDAGPEEGPDAGPDPGPDASPDEGSAPGWLRALAALHAVNANPSAQSVITNRGVDTRE